MNSSTDSETKENLNYFWPTIQEAIACQLCRNNGCDSVQLATDSDSNKSEPDVGRMSRPKSHACSRGPSSKGQRGSLRRMTLTFLIEHTQEFYLRAYTRSPPLIGTISLQIPYIPCSVVGISIWYLDWPSLWSWILIWTIASSFLCPYSPGLICLAWTERTCTLESTHQNAHRE